MAYPETITSSWVGQDDVAALLCLDFLRRMKVGVPQEISVAGFDDSPRASLKGLTSINFGSQAVIHAMMQYILDIKIPLTTRRNTAVELDGFVNVRSTTGPASEDRGVLVTLK